MIGPALFTQTFAKFIDPKGIHLVGAPFFLGALLIGVAFVLAWIVTKHERDIASAARERAT